MALVDKVVTAVVLSGLTGTVAVRAVLSWIDFRRQQRVLRLMVESVEVLEGDRPRNGVP